VVLTAQSFFAHCLADCIKGLRHARRDDFVTLLGDEHHIFDTDAAKLIVQEVHDPLLDEELGYSAGI